MHSGDLAGGGRLIHAAHSFILVLLTLTHPLTSISVGWPLSSPLYPPQLDSGSHQLLVYTLATLLTDMRLSLLAATLAVLSIPVSAAPHKVARCVAKKSITPGSSTTDIPPASSTSSESSSGSATSQAEVSTADPSPTSTSNASSETSSAVSSTDAASSSSEPVASSSSTTAANPAPTVLVAPEDKADGSSEAFRDQILQLHNQLRAQYNATDLKWDQALGDSAAAWVDQCNFDASNTPYTSENIAAGQGSNLLPYLFQQWAQEKDVYDMNHPGLTGFNGGVTGHFTQIVWKGSTSLGCAWKACPAGKIQPGWTGTATYLACQFSPPGNYAPGGNGTLQSFCDNVGCSDSVRNSLPLPDSVQGTTVQR